MQYVRQAITYSATSPQEVIAATEQTTARKLREMPATRSQLEKELTKDQILERYLNIAAFGHGAYGIYAASQVYFDKEPKDLTLAEAALLAGLPKAPSDLRPGHRERPPAGAGAPRRTCSTRWSSIGMITPGSRPTPAKAELKVTGKRTPNGCVADRRDPTGASSATTSTAGGSTRRRSAPTRPSGSGRLKSGGYRIITTLDVEHPGLGASSNVEEQQADRQPGRADAGRDRAGHRPGQAMAANRNYSLTTPDAEPALHRPGQADEGHQGHLPEHHQPAHQRRRGHLGYKAGSTFKMFTMVAALEKGYPLDFTINARSPYQSPVYPSATGDAGACPRPARTGARRTPARAT